MTDHPVTFTVVHPARGPSECTLHPADVPGSTASVSQPERLCRSGDADDETILTTWLSALEGSYVDLEAAR